MGRELALGVLLAASCALLAYISTAFDVTVNGAALLLGSGQQPDLSWVQVLAGAAVEPIQGKQAQKRDVLPRGWRHARVLSSAVGQTAPWAAQAAAAEAASRQALRGPAERAARGRAVEERRRQQMSRDNVHYEQMRRARQAAEKEERFAAAGNLQDSLRTIATFMAPHGREARSRFQRAVDNFMAKEQARELAVQSRSHRPGHGLQATGENRMEQEQKHEEEKVHRMKQAQNFMGRVKSIDMPSKPPQIKPRATSPKAVGKVVPSVEIAMNGRRAQIELPISGGELEVPLQRVAVTADDKALDVPIVGMNFKRIRVGKGDTGNKNVGVKHKQAMVADSLESRSRSELAKGQVKAKRTIREDEAKEDELRRQKALENAESSFPSGRVMEEGEDNDGEVRVESEREKRKAKVSEAKKEERRQEKALAEAASSFPSDRHVKEEEEEYERERSRREEEDKGVTRKGENKRREEKALEDAESSFPAGEPKYEGAVETSSERGYGEQGRQTTRYADAEHQRAEEEEEAVDRHLRVQRMKGAGMMLSKHQEVLVSLALRVPLRPDDCSASVRDKIEEAIAEAAGVGASQVSVVSFGKYSDDGQATGGKVEDGVLDKRKDLSVERNETAIHEAAMRLQDEWIGDFEASGELGSDELKDKADAGEDDGDGQAPDGSRRRLLSASAGDEDDVDQGADVDGTQVDVEIKALRPEAAEDIVAHLTEESINAELEKAGLPCAELVRYPHVGSHEDHDGDKGAASPDESAPKPKHHSRPHPHGHPDLSHHARHAPEPHWKMPGGIWRHHEARQPMRTPTKLEHLGVNVDGVGGVYRAFAVPFFDETQVYLGKDSCMQALALPTPLPDVHRMF